MLVTVMLLAAALPTLVLPPSPAFAAPPLACDGTTIYIQDDNGRVRAFNTQTRTLGGSNVVTGLKGNALGIPTGGQYVYTADNTGAGSAKSIRIHNRVTEQNTDVALTNGSNWNYLIRGAVHPVTGLYYFASSHQGSNAVRLGAYDPATQQAFQVGQVTGLAGASSGWINGDLAFTASGRLVITSDSNVYVLDQDVPTTSGTTTLTATLRGNIGSSVSNGIAFGYSGNLFISTGSSVIEFNLATGTQVGSAVNLGGFAPTDMASCQAFPSTLTLQKELVGDRVDATDQFGLSVTGQPYLTNNTTVTTGNASGIQAERVGPIFVTSGHTFTLAESAAGTTDLGNYATSLACYDAASANAPVSVVSLPPGPDGGPRWSLEQPLASNNSGADVVCTLTNTAMVPGIDLVKTNSGGPVDVGDTVSYEFEITNTGTTHLTGITLADDTVDGTTLSPDAATLAALVLAPNASTTVTASYVATQADVDAGSIVNAATATGIPSDPSGDPTGQDPVEDDDTSTVPTEGTPGIALVKTNSGGPVDVGDTVTYDFEISNTGTTHLTGITLADDTVDASSFSPDATTLAAIVLAPGSSTTVTASYVATQADVNAGSIVNIATATGTPSDPAGDPTGQDPVDDEDSSTVPTQGTPGIALVKTNSGGPVDVGDTVSYDFEITNTGTTHLTGITLADDTVDGATISPDAATLAALVLAPNASTTVTASYVATQADVDAGSIVNIATATGTPSDPAGDPTGQDPVDDEDTSTVPTQGTPGIALVKTNSGGPVDVGDTVSYDFEITNTGTTHLTGITLADDTVDGATISPDAATLAAIVLAPGTSTTVTASYVATQGDVDAGSIVNIATTTGTPSDPSGDPTGQDPVDDEDSSTVPTQGAPSIELVKTNSGGPVDVGDTVSYDFEITNTGTTHLTGITLADDTVDLATISPDAATLAAIVLAPGASTTVTASYVATQADVDAGSIVNAATAAGTPSDPSGDPTGDDPVEDDDTSTVPTEGTPGIALVKTNSGGPVDVGDTVSYEFEITNTGTTHLTGITLADDTVDGATISPDAATLAAIVLAPGTSTTVTASYVATQGDVDAGSIVNIATTTGTPSDPAGDPTGQDPVDDEDSSTVPTQGAASIELVKTNSGGPVDVGDTVSYSFEITNTGTTHLTGITLADDTVDAATISPDAATLAAIVLAPGTSTTVTASYTATQADVDAGSIVNAATVTGTPSDPSGDPTGDDPVEDDDTSTVPTEGTPGISLVKTNSGGPVDVGDTVSYSFEITNTGTTHLTGITLTDDTVDAATISPDAATLAALVLAPNASTTVTASYVATQADVDAGSIVNVATTTGTPSDPAGDPTGQDPVDDEDSSTVPTQGTPGIELVKTNSGGPVDVGDTVTYDFEITNTGTTHLTGITLADDTVDASSFSPDAATLAAIVLAPGTSTTVTASYTATQADVDAGSIVNIATTTGTPSDPSGDPTGQDPVDDEDSSTVPTQGTPGIGLVKTNSGGPVDVGDTVSYDFEITNTGTTHLTGITLADDTVDGATVSPDAATLAAIVLAPGTSTTVTASYVATQGDVDAGSIVNIATTTGTPSDPAGDPTGQDPVDDEDSSTVPTEGAPGIVLVKTNSGGPVDVGDTVSYDFEITNTGTTHLTGITLADDTVDGATISPDAATLAALVLAPNTSTTVTASYVATQADVDAGSIVNFATATGTPSDSSGDPTGDDPVDDDDTSTVPTEGTPGIALVKTNSGGPVDVGDTVSYDFEITNTGTTHLTGITLADDTVDGATLSPDAATLAAIVLAPGTSTTVTASYVATQGDVDAGSIVNIATTTGTPSDPAGDPTGQDPVDDEDSSTVPTEGAPGIGLVKTNSGGPVDVGDTVSYEFEISNTGTTHLTGITLSDDTVDGATVSPDAATLAAIVLAPGTSTTVTASYTATQADVDAGSIVNVATASGTPSDPSGDPTGDDPVDDDDTSTVPTEGTPGIGLVKTNSGGPVDVGDTVSYDFEITNTGTTHLTGITLADDTVDGATVSPDAATLAAIVLAPGTSTTVTASYVATQGDVDAGSIVNIATTTGTPSDPAGDPTGQDPVDDEDSSTVPTQGTPGIGLAKTNSGGPVDVGDTVSYDFEITNTGTTHLTGITLADDTVDGATVSPDAATLAAIVLAPGTSTTVTASYLVTQADVDAGSIVNIATATGTPSDPSGDPTGQDPVDDEDSSTVPTEGAPGIGLVKTNSGGPVDVGDTVSYDFEITNTGTTHLTGITLSDDTVDAATISPDAATLAAIVLAPGTSTTVTASYTATQADVDAGSIVNIATTTGTPSDPSGDPTGDDPVEDDDTSTVPTEGTPGIALVKTNSGGPVDVGDTVSYDFEITNTGTTHLTGITLTDDTVDGTTISPDAATLAAIVLAPGTSTTVTASYTATQADVDAGSIVNVATATGTPSDPSGDPTGQDPVDDEDSSTVPTQGTPGIALVKTNSGGPVDVGDTVSYDFEITNTGTTHLTGITLSDDTVDGATISPDAATLAAIVLAPGTSTTVTASYVATQGDVDAGSIVNIATTTGTPSDPSGDPTGQDPVDDEDSSTVPTEGAPGIGLVKTNSGGPVDVGDTVSYEFEITNTGTTHLTGITLSDDTVDGATISPDAATLAAIVLAPGTSTTVTASYIATQADVDAGSIVNVATASGTPSDPSGDPTGDDPVEDDDSSTVPTEGTPGLELVKTNSGGPVDVGDTVSYDFEITNTGTTHLTGITLADDTVDGSTVSPDAATLAAIVLAPGTSTTVTASYVATQADVDAGSIVNIATATGTPSDPSGEPTGQDPVDDEDSSTVPTEGTPGLELVKTNSGGPVDVGDTVTYDFEITNTGTTHLTGITLADDTVDATTLSPDAATLAAIVLAPGTSTTVTASYTATQADVNAGSIVNVATASGTPSDPSGDPSGDDPVEDDDTTTVPTQGTPGIALVKTNSGGPVDVGDTVTYDFEITNTGTTHLAGITLADDTVDASSFSPDAAALAAIVLAPGTSTTVTASYTATQADVDAGSIVNIATASGTPSDPSGDPTGQDPVDDEDSSTVPTQGTPGIALVKTNSGGPVDVGDTVAYEFEITNTGTTHLTGITLADDTVDGATLSPDAATLAAIVLAPGSSTTVTASYVATQGDVDAGSIVNVATASGTPSDPSGDPTGQDPVDDEDSSTVPTQGTPGIALVKTNSGGPVDVGDTVSYEFEITNTGTTHLTAITLADDTVDGTTLSPDAATLAAIVLAPGASTTVTASYVATQADVNAGSIVNIATTTGTPSDPSGDPTGQDPVDDKDSSTVPTQGTPGIALVKTNSGGPVDVGDTVSYEFEITNTGTTHLTGITLADDTVDSATISPDVATLAAIVLAPGSSTTVSASYTATQADVDAGSIVNIATTTGTPSDPSGDPTGQDPVEDDDTTTVPTQGTPAIALVKTNSGGPVDVGDTVSYEFEITNTGTTHLTGITLADDTVDSATISPDAATLAAIVLAPGTSTVVTASYVATQGDVDAGSIVNIATATGTPSDPAGDPTGQEPVEDDDTTTVPTQGTPGIALVKTNSGGPVDVGDTVSYEFEITNTGTTHLTGITLADDTVDSATISPDAATLAAILLAPGASTTVTASYVATQGDVDAGSIVNIATAAGTPSDPSGDPTGQDPVDDEDSSTVPTEGTPGIALAKTNSGGPVDVGDTVTYDFEITNTGTTHLTGITLADDTVDGATVSPDAATLAAIVLAPGTSTTVTASYTATQADVDAGSIVNVATASGTPSDPSGEPTGDDPVEDDDTSTVTSQGDPAIALVKTNSGGPVDVGDTVTYDFEITNTGTTHLTGITLADDTVDATTLSPDAATLAAIVLAPGSSTTVTASYTATQADVDAGSIVNIATATGTPSGPSGDPTGQDPVDDQDTSTVPTQGTPGIALVKTNSGGPVDVGDTVTFSFEITNTGTTHLTGIALDDDTVDATTVSPDAATLAAIVLAPGTSTTVTASYTATQADVYAGSIVNVATASGTPSDPSGEPTGDDPVEDDDTTTVTTQGTPAIELVKTAQTPNGTEAGDVVSYQLVATNTGTTVLVGVTIDDPMLGGNITPSEASAWSSGTVGTLAPGDTVTTTRTYTVTQADVAAGSIHNTATATGTDESSGESTSSSTVTDSDSVTVTTTATPTTGTLPRTGLSDTFRNLVGAGLASLLLGAMLIVGIRRRDELA